MRFPPARFSSTHHGRNRHGYHAMPHDRRDSGNDPRVRGIDVKGTRESFERPDPPSSSRHNAPSELAEDCGREGSRGRGSDAIQELAPRGSRRDNDPLPDYLLPRSSTPDQSYHDHQLQPQKQPNGSLRRRRRRESIPPDGESRSLPVPRDYETTRPAAYLSIEILDRRPPRSPSPSIRRQQRSLSPFADESQPKRRRQDPSLRRSNREPHTAPFATYAPRLYRSPPPRDNFLTRREHRHRTENGPRAYTPPLPDRGRLPSPRLDSKFAENPNLVPLGQRPSSRHDLDRSPAPTLLSLSRSQRRTSPLSQRGRRPSNSYIDIGRRQTPDSAFEENSGARPPLRESFRNDRQELFPSHNQRRQDRYRSQVELPDLASGANSVEVNMSARGNFRGNHGGRHYNQGAHDSRNYTQSSSHGTPNSSVQGSPPAQPSHSGGRGSWSGQNHHQPQFSSNGYTPTAPAAHFQGNSANAPPAGTPTGPSAQFNRGGYRGGGAFRGPGPGRGGGRGGFKSGHWGSGGNGSRATSSQPDDASSGRGTPQASNAGETSSHYSETSTHEADNPFRPPKELQVEDTGGEEKRDGKPMPPPHRPPPTGPAAEKKISFALKLTPKAPVATPKLEISSKFSAPTKKDPPKEPSRHERGDRHERHERQERPDPRDAKSRRDPRDTRKDSSHPKHAAETRDLPRNVPTEPRAAKVAEQQRLRQQEHPREPRVRKVKKKMKRLKPKPSLPDDLVGSDSVYFRKPGNESVIGAGTYGKVFKALHVYTKKLVALKRIRMEGERDGFPVTAVREIKLLQSLRHINIVALLEVMVEKNECYMVFEYMSHDLTGILNHPTFKLDAAHRKHLSKQLFEGLDYLHQRGVLHRDIKAANILVSSDGILKLADFGLARFYAKRHQLDYTNRVITIWYRSPELLLGETQYSPAVDIWSAACVMVEIFTRRAIFPGDGGEISQLDKIYSVLGTPHRSEWPRIIDMPWFELLRPGARKPSVFEEQYKDRLPPAAFELITEMFRYDPDKRPSAAQVLEHPYFTTEAPAARQVVELQQIEGDWHEFESKALRRENERKEREARKAAEKGTRDVSGKENKDSKKRPPESNDVPRESKRQHVETVLEDASATQPEA